MKAVVPVIDQSDEAVSNWHSPQKFRVAIEEQREEEILKAKRRLKQEKILTRLFVWICVVFSYEKSLSTFVAFCY